MRARRQTGSAIVEFVWLGVLLMVPLLYVLLATFDAQRTAFAAAAAARSASRSFVQAADQASGYRAAAVAAATAFEDQGLPGARFVLTISCRPSPNDCLVPGSVVSARIGAAAVLPLMPAVFGSNPPSISISAVHSSPYGTFREPRP